MLFLQACQTEQGLTDVVAAAQQFQPKGITLSTTEVLLLLSLNMSDWCLCVCYILVPVYVPHTGACVCATYWCLYVPHTGACVCATYWCLCVCHILLRTGTFVFCYGLVPLYFVTDWCLCILLWTGACVFCCGLVPMNFVADWCLCMCSRLVSVPMS